MSMSEVAKWSILIVDDERDNLEVVAETLGFFGANVKTAKDGLDALEAMKTFTPTHILLDLSMPVMDGWTMLGRLREKEELRHIPVIALTAHAMQTDKDRVYAAGFDGYLTKPVNVPTIVKDILGALEEGKAMKAAAAPAASEQPAAEAKPEVKAETPAAEAQPAASTDKAEVAPAPVAPETEKTVKSNGAEDTHPSVKAEERPTTETAAIKPESVAETGNTVQSKSEETSTPASENGAGNSR